MSPEGKRKRLSEVLRERLPSLISRGVTTLLSVLVYLFVLPILPLADATIPGTPFSFQLLLTSIMVIAIFLLAGSVLADLYVVIDASMDLVAAKLPGVKEEKSVQRALNELTWAVGVMLLAAVTVPGVSSLAPGLGTLGFYLRVGVPVVFFFVIVALLYDSIRVLYVLTGTKISDLVEGVVKRVEEMEEETEAQTAKEKARA